MSARAITNLSVLVSFFLTTPAFAETVPIPPKRPTVMNVSPSYIEELLKRDAVQKPNVTAKSLNDIPPSSHANRHTIVDETGKHSAIEKLDVQRLVSALDSVDHDPSAPIPKHKPIQPKDSKNVDEKHGTTIVSFALRPEQIDLDPNLKNFLLEHVVEAFKSDPALKMEIHAYATHENEQEYSDVRRSLARALEVRSFLLSNNIAPSRLKLSPFGQDENNKSDDRIDLLFVASK